MALDDSPEANKKYRRRHNSDFLADQKDSESSSVFNLDEEEALQTNKDSAVHDSLKSSGGFRHYSSKARLSKTIVKKRASLFQQKAYRHMNSDSPKKYSTKATNNGFEKQDGINEVKVFVDSCNDPSLPLFDKAEKDLEDSREPKFIDVNSRKSSNEGGSSNQYFSKKPSNRKRHLVLPIDQSGGRIKEEDERSGGQNSSYLNRLSTKLGELSKSPYYSDHPSIPYKATQNSSSLLKKMIKRITLLDKNLNSQASSSQLQCSTLRKDASELDCRAFNPKLIQSFCLSGNISHRKSLKDTSTGLNPSNSKRRKLQLSHDWRKESEITIKYDRNEASAASFERVEEECRSLDCISGLEISELMRELGKVFRRLGLDPFIVHISNEGSVHSGDSQRQLRTDSECPRPRGVQIRGCGDQSRKTRTLP